MKSNWFNYLKQGLSSGVPGPDQIADQAEELSLSGPALLDLMGAVLSKGLPLRFRAKGWSMTPFIRDGDVITVSPFNQNRPRLGDVVAFKRPETGNLIVHRIVSLQDGSVHILGDSIPDKPDGIIPIEALLGQVTRVERDGRRLRLGLGPERVLIAWLSRTGVLTRLRDLVSAWRTRWPSRKRRT